jgi:sulfur relay (sulfurtransferase) DsrF/TusC family protein
VHNNNNNNNTIDAAITATTEVYVKYVVKYVYVIETSLRPKRFCEKHCVIQVLYILRGDQDPSNRALPPP